MWSKILVFFLFISFKCCIILATLTQPTIIVIGSGPSGIAAATRLLKHGYYNLTILEAENRIGGRINSVFFGNAYVDLGAEFCHGEEGNIVHSMVKDLGVLKHSKGTFVFHRSNGEIIDRPTSRLIENFAKALSASNETIEGCDHVKSVGDCLDIKFETFPSTGQNTNQKTIFSETYDWTESYLCSYDSPFDSHDLMITSEYRTCGGDLGQNWNGFGYKTILEIMMQKFPNSANQLPIDDKIHYNKTVAKIINWREGDWVEITTTDGEIYKANHVIFTPSVGVLKANHGNLFEPPLPEEKSNAIDKIGFGAILKVILHFEGRWWGDRGRFSFIWTAKDKEGLKKDNLQWLTCLSGFAPGENNPNVLIAWYAGESVPLIESLPDEEILKGHKYILDKFLAPHYNVTALVNFIKTSWYSNPNFRGTYSYESVKGYSKGGNDFQKKLESPLLNDENRPTVLFAGEATHSYYFSTVHGAIESGYREADRLIDLYKA